MTQKKKDPELLGLALFRTIGVGRKSNPVKLFFFGFNEYGIPIYALDPRKAKLYADKLLAEKDRKDFDLAADHQIVKVYKNGTTKILSRYDTED